MLTLRLYCRLCNILKHMQHFSPLTSKGKLISQRIYLKHAFSYSNFPASSVKETGLTSKYHPGSFNDRIEQTIKDILLSTKICSYDDWNDIKNNLMTDYALITESNFSSIIMNSLLLLNKIDLAHSFMKYLTEANITINFLTRMKYLSLCSKNLDLCDQAIIHKTLKKIKPIVDAQPILDMKLTEYVIHGLCATEHWRDSFEYLKKLPQKPSMEIRNTIACAALKNGDEALSWDILTKWMKPGEYPSDKVYREFMKHALKLLEINHEMSNVFILKLFKYIQEKEAIISDNAAQLIGTYFKRESPHWKVSYSKLDRKGECDSCKKNIKLLHLSEEEFVYLRLQFLQKSVKKTDLFINTTEKEFNNFIRFIDGKIPYNIVLDGLNAAYTCQSTKTARNLSFQLLNVVKMLSSKNKKLLVLGRHQMYKWPLPTMEKIRKHADVFLTHNISQDDPFVVYATLASGPDTYFLSSDLMRDHISRLENPKLIQLFKKWQQSHQIFLSIDNDNNLKFIEPLRHSISLQGSMEDGWHIPFDDKILLDPYEELNNWLCVQKLKM